MTYWTLFAADQVYLRDFPQTCTTIPLGLMGLFPNHASFINLPLFSSLHGPPQKVQLLDSWEGYNLSLRKSEANSTVLN